MRITTAGAGTIFSSPIPNGRLEVPGAYLQTGSDTAVQLNAAADWAAQKICPRTDWQLNALAWYVTAVAAEGNAAIKLFSDDGAADSNPDSAIATLSDSFGSGDAADVWRWDDGFTPCQLQRGKTYWLVFQGTDGADFSLSCRRWNTNVGSMFPDETPAAKISTDGGSSWSALTQGSKPAILNIVLNASANIVPPLIYGRYNGQYVYLPGMGVREIPDAGVSLACDALTADTLYYVYLYDNSGTLTLEASATVPTLSEGILVKTGATTRRYLGMIYPRELYNDGTGYQGPVDCMDSRLVLNHYNRAPKTLGKLCPYSANTND
ncbi:MAG: choice-of-anchor R domain-containing protein, partial [Deltaproteobacteria bacterium]